MIVKLIVKCTKMTVSAVFGRFLQLFRVVTVIFSYKSKFFAARIIYKATLYAVLWTPFFNGVTAVGLGKQSFWG